MNHTFVLSRTQTLPWISFRKLIQVKFLRLFWILNGLLIIAFLVFYIFQVNAEVSERYLIQEQEKRIAEISKENQNLEIKSAQKSSLDNITLLLKEFNFEKTDKIHYIRVLDTQVVAK